MSLLGTLTVGIVGNMTGLSNTLTQSQNQVRQFGRSMQQVGSNLMSVGSSLTTLVTVPVAAIGGASLKAAIDFESAFAGVRKTVDATEKEFAQFEKEIRAMAKEIPAAATEIAAVAEAAGQLGIEKENLMGFTRVMIDLGVATNLSSDEAATALARLANITQMPQDQFDRLGATIVDLGNNLATTEADIVHMALRIAGAGNQIGLTEAQILSFAGALSSVGIEAEMGGSAISRVMIEIANAVNIGGDYLGQFAKVAGVSSADFKKAFEKDAAEAVVMFIEGLDRMSKSGENVFMVLDELGLSEIRVRDTLLRAAGAGDLFRKTLDLGNKAWEENVALTNEAEERYKTTESQLKILWNRVKDIGITIGQALAPALLSAIDAAEPLIKVVESLANWFKDLDPAIQTTIIAVAAVGAALGPLILVLGTAITSIGTIVGLVAGAGGLSAVLMAFATNPVTLAVAGLAAIGIGIAGIVSDIKEDAIPEVERFGEGVSESTKEALEGYFELADGASLKLTELKLHQQEITEEARDQLVGTYSQMKDQVLQKMDERHSAELEKLQTHFMNSSALTEEEEQKILEQQQRHYDLRAEVLESIERRRTEIIDTALKERRTLTEQEYAEISRLDQKMNEEAVQYLSKNELESKVILEQMKQTAGDLTALQAAEVVKNSAKQKNEAVKEADAQYNETVAAIIKMRDETGAVTAEQADKLIREAKKQHGETVKHAEDMHNKVVAEAKAQAGEHIDNVNWETGEVLSKWEVFKNNTVKVWEDTKKGVVDLVKEMKRDVVETSGKIKDEVADKWKKVEDFFRSIDLKGIGKDIINGLISGITLKGDELLKSARNLGNKVINGFKSAMKIFSPSRVMRGLGENVGEGLILGIEDSMREVERASHELATAATPTIPFDKLNPSLGGFGSLAGQGQTEFSSNAIMPQRYQQPIIIQMVTPDERVMAEWLVNPISEIQSYKTKIFNIFEGR